MVSVQIVFGISVIANLAHPCRKFTIGKCLTNDKHMLLFHKQTCALVIFWSKYINYGLNFNI